MKRELREQLRQYYEAPSPAGKQEFLRKMHGPRRRTGAMLMVQLRYIPVSAWVLSTALFVLMLLSERLLFVYYAGTAYALVPFLSVTTISVSMRSGRYHMAELERTTLFSLGSVIMMRMLLLGAGNFLMLAAWAFFAGTSFFAAELMYILVPYMLTASGSLMVYRRYAQRDANYMSLVVSGGVAALELSAVHGAAFLFEDRYVGVWAAGCALLAVLFAVQIRKSAKSMEDMVWN